MQIAFAFARKHLAGAAAVLFAAALAVSFVLPVQAHALDVERWTAKPNKDGDNTTVLGATATRVTWQGQTAEDESLASVTIEMPEGTTVGAENVKTTVLVGLDRLDAASEAVVDGNDVTVTLAEPAPAGALVMVECNRTLLPGGGGSFGLAGSYTTADGQRHDMPATDQVINVTGTSPAEQLSSWLNQQDWVKAWNSNKFLHLFFDPVIIVTSVPALFAGWLVSIGVVVVSFPLAIPLGLLLSFLRMAKHRLPRAIGATYINICLLYTSSAKGLVRTARREHAACRELASRTAASPSLEDAARAAAEAFPDARAVLDAAARRDPSACAALERFSEALGFGLSQIACVVDPDVLVLGGGLSERADLFLGAVRARYRACALPPCRNTPIVVSKLGNACGMYGAASRALDLLARGECSGTGERLL